MSFQYFEAEFLRTYSEGTDLKVCEQLLRQMEIEASMNKQLSVKVKKYRDDFEAWKSRERRREDEKNKDLLLGDYARSKEELKTDALIADQNLKLEQGIKIGLECERSAVDTRTNLYDQRVTLERAVKNNRDMEDNLSTADKILKKLNRWFMF